MKKLFLISLVIFSAQAYSFFFWGNSSNEDKQFPDPDQVYVPGKDVGFSKYLTRSLRGTKKVVLTFDDGPDVNHTPRLLDTLKEYNVKATFFILTERINAQTLPIVRRMINEGHTLASHHHDHISNDTKTEEMYRVGLKSSIRATAGLMEEENALRREIYYRFPYGAYGSSKRAYHHMNVMKEVSRELFADNCINFAFWDIDTADWVGNMTSDDIVQNVLGHVVGGTAFNFKKNSKGIYEKVKYTITKPIGGGVVLMHDVHKKSVDSVPKMLQEFRKRNIDVIEIQEVEEFSFGAKECRLI